MSRNKEPPSRKQQEWRSLEKLIVAAEYNESARPPLRTAYLTYLPEVILLTLPEINLDVYDPEPAQLTPYLFDNCIAERIRNDPNAWRPHIARLVDKIRDKMNRSHVLLLDTIVRSGLPVSGPPWFANPDDFRWRLSLCDVDPDHMQMHWRLLTKMVNYTVHSVYYSRREDPVLIPTSQSVARLLAMGAEPSLQDQYGETALHTALNERRLSSSQEEETHELDVSIHMLLLAGTRQDLETGKNMIHSRAAIAPAKRKRLEAFLLAREIIPGPVMELLLTIIQRDRRFMDTFDATRDEARELLAWAAEEMAPIVAACRRIYRNNGSMVYAKNVSGRGDVEEEKEEAVTTSAASARAATTKGGRKGSMRRTKGRCTKGRRRHTSRRR